MRPGLVVALLLGAAALVGVVHWDRQGRPAFWRSVLARSSDGADARPPRAEVQLEPPQPGWARVVLGGPSGAEPLVDPTLVAPAPRVRTSLPDFELVVRPGQVLSRIVREHYGHAATWLVEALTDYNGLTDPNALDIGRTLYLPEIEKLTE